MKYIQIIVVLIAFQWQLNVSAVQNLCGDARDASLTFADDPASCNRYLYCTFNSDGSVNTTFQLKCEDPAFPNFSEDYCMPAGSFDCLTTTCPDFNQGIFYGTDDLCKNFALCRGTGTIGVGSCTGTDTFDRSSGTCVDVEWAPCYSPPGGPTVECAGVADGTLKVVPGTKCMKYVICYNNLPDGPFECRPDHVFDSDLSVCVSADEYTCLDVRRTETSVHPENIPIAKRKRHPNDIPF